MQAGKIAYLMVASKQQLTKAKALLPKYVTNHIFLMLIL